MFRKAGKEAEWAGDQGNVKEVCNIAAGTVIEGNVKVNEAHMRLEGTIQGNVFCVGRVVLSKTAYIKGDIDCFDLVSEGKIEGNVQVRDGVQLLASATMTGNIQCKRLQIENGAVFNGQCAMPTT